MLYHRSRRHLGLFELCLIDEKASVHACKTEGREDLGCIRMQRRKIGDGIATSGEEGTATAGVIELRLLSDVDPELGVGVRPTLPSSHSHSRLSQNSTPPLSSSFFNIPFSSFYFNSF